MRVAIIGSRNFQDLRQVVVYVYDHLVPGRDVIITGGAQGVDETAAEAGRRHGCAVVVHEPDYKRYGRGAPLVRNKLIVSDCDQMIAFWDGKSRGTLHAVRAMREAKKKFFFKLDREFHDLRKLADAQTNLFGSRDSESIRRLA